jgi:AcrR family transcriptional regulator
MVGRPQLHSKDTMLDAARELLLKGGPRAATLNAISEASGAPKGSLYHWFGSRDELMAEMWIRAVRRSQQKFLESIQAPEPMVAAVRGALAIHDFAIRESKDARLLASMRRQDLVENIQNPALRRALQEVNGPLRSALVQLTRRLFGRLSSARVDATTCAVVDLPLGATRRYLVVGSPIPVQLRGQLDAAVRAALIYAGAGGGTSRCSTRSPVIS